MAARFDEAFFEELDRLDKSVVNTLQPIDGYVPHIDEAFRRGKVSERFLLATQSLISGVAHQSSGKFSFHKFFRVYPQHIFSFEPGRSFRSQYSIAFDSPSRGMRVGIGFRMEQSGDAKGRIDYAWFEAWLGASKRAFDAAMNALNGGYGELPDAVMPLPSEMMFAHKPKPADEWRFFGYWLDAAELKQLDVGRVADRCVEVFEILRVHGIIARWDGPR